MRVKIGAAHLAAQLKQLCQDEEKPRITLVPHLRGFTLIGIATIKGEPDRTVFALRLPEAGPDECMRAGHALLSALGAEPVALTFYERAIGRTHRKGQAQ